MDKTEMYVKMADCEDVQGQWVPKPGDFISHTTTNLITGDVVNEITQLCMCSEFGKEVEKCEWGEKTIWIEYEGHDYIAKYKNPTWLPTQDQIQGMLGPQNTTDGYVWTCILLERHSNGKFPSNIDLLTWEQKWLSIYMGHKHNKTWDGEKWVKNK